MQRLYFANVSTFSNKDFQTIFQNQSKSVKSTASKICRMSRTKTGRALVYVVNDRYDVALAISLSLKASNIFPILVILAQKWSKIEIFGKIGKIGKITSFCKGCRFFIFNVV